MDETLNLLKEHYLDYTKKDQVIFESLLSNSKFAHVGEGLLKVYEELKVPLEIYFQGPYFHLAIAKSVLFTIREFRALVDNEEMDDLDISSKVVLKKNFESLNFSVRDVNEHIVSFHNNVSNFLLEYAKYVQKNMYIKLRELLSKTNDGVFEFNKKCPYGGELRSSLKGILESDRLISKLLRQSSNPEKMKMLSNKSWKLYVDLLSFCPEQNFMIFAENMLNFRSKAQKVDSKESLESLFPFYYEFVHSKKIDVSLLKEPLKHFKEQYHDSWTDYKIANYFS